MLRTFVAAILGVSMLVPVASCRVLGVLPTTITLAPPPDAARSPLVAMFVRDGWMSVIGFDLPLVVVYDDGSVICMRERDGEITEGHIGRDAAKRLAESTLRQISSRGARGDGFDQPTTEIMVREGDRWTQNQAYGLSRGALISGEASDTFRNTSFYEAGRVLVTLDPADARPLQPETIEVMLWASGATHAVPWPEGIPPPDDMQLHSADENKGVYSYDVTAKYTDSLRAFLGSLDHETAVNVRGHHVGMLFRRVVPGDAILHVVDVKVHQARGE